MITCTKCQGEGWHFKGNLFTFCGKCDGEGGGGNNHLSPCRRVFPLHPTMAADAVVGG